MIQNMKYIEFNQNWVEKVFPTTGRLCLLKSSKGAQHQQEIWGQKKKSGHIWSNDGWWAGPRIVFLKGGKKMYVFGLFMEPPCPQIGKLTLRYMRPPKTPTSDTGPSCPLAWPSSLLLLCYTIFALLSVTSSLCLQDQTPEAHLLVPKLP